MDAPRYQTPAVTDHGTLAELTAQTSSGAQLDAVIPAGTPISELPGIISTSLS